MVEHNTLVRRIARSYDNRGGWKVTADISGFPCPPPIGDFIPDLYLKKRQQTRIMEVERNIDSLVHGNGLDQLKTFKRVRGRVYLVMCRSDDREQAREVLRRHGLRGIMVLTPRRYGG